MRRGLLIAVALSVPGIACADLPDPFNNTLYGTNFFNWVDFDSTDTAVSQPKLALIQQPANGWTGYVGERLTHDDNVYRLPAPQITPATTADYSRSDIIDTISGGVDARCGASRQSLEVLARLDKNLYSRNAHLDNVTQSLAALGNWAVGRRLSGQVGASYDHYLAQFGNYVLLDINFGLPKNMSTMRKFMASSELWLSYHWVIHANGLRRSSSSQENRFDIFTSDTGSLGIEYYTAGGTVAGVTYTYTKGIYELPAVVSDIQIDRDFRERTSAIQFQVPLGDRLVLHADGGYVTHDYPRAPVYNFKGSIWDFALSAQTSAKTGLLLTGSRHLYPLIDADSQYYVSGRLSAIARWAPTAKLTLELQFSRENQDFIGPNPVTGTLLLPKHNTSRVRQVNFAWSLSRAVQVIAAYNFGARTSNVPVLTYDQNLLSATLQARF